VTREGAHLPADREVFLDNLLVRIHLIFEMILVDRPCAMAAHTRRFRTRRRLTPRLSLMGVQGKSLRKAHPPWLLTSAVNQFRGGLVFKAHRLVYHSTLGLRVIKKKKTSAAVAAHIFTNLSSDPLMMNFPSGEKATECTLSAWPVCLHTCRSSSSANVS